MRFLTANDRTMWVGIDETAHHIIGRISDRRFGAYLAPFGCEEDAIAALLDAGGVLDTVATLRKPGRTK